MILGDVVISADGLARHFDGVRAVDGVSFEVRAGEVFGLLGHNGAGKTTTLRLVNGLIAPTAGALAVLGLDPAADGAALRRRTGVLTSTPALDEHLTAAENLTVYGAMYGVDRDVVARRVGDLLDLFDLGAAADQHARSLSSGMKQRVALARALVHDPELLLLDEPTTGLDPIAAGRVRDLIAALSRERGRTVVVCTHNLVEAEALCDRVAILRHGRLVALGTLDELNRRVAATSGVRVDVAPDALAAALAAAGQVEGVGTAVADGDGRILATAARETIPALVAALVAAGVAVYGISEVVPSLEDVYVALYDGADTAAPDGVAARPGVAG